MKMQIRTNLLNDGLINQIGKGDEITLELARHTSKASKYIKVKVVELTSEIERCNGCKCLLRAKTDRFKFRAGVYCDFCYKRRIDEQREITQRSANLKKLI